MAAQFYSESIDSSHITATGGKGYMEAWADGFASSGYNNESESSKVIASFDGAAQWTCSPNNVAEVPEADELYNRKEDPFQLNNVIDQHPEVAKELLTMLTSYIDDLKNS